MAMKYANVVGAAFTPQSEPLAGQKENNAGGFAYVLDKWKQLDRFLILGSIGGTFYTGERKLTKDNAKVVGECMKEDYDRTVRAIVAVSDGGRAPKNDPAVFALALASADPRPEARRAALGALPKVCRIPTHLFQFIAVAEGVRGWGRGLRTAVGNWYNAQNADHLAYEIAKYQQREGWSNRDLLRLAHPSARSVVHNDIFRYIVKGHDGKSNLPSILYHIEQLKKNPTAERAVACIKEVGLTREMIPTELLKSVSVWEALLERMPLNAMVRNLGKMASLGMTSTNLNFATKLICSRLEDRDYIRKSRLHPVAIMVASAIYEAGRGEKGKLTWEPNSRIVNALDKAFYLAFDNVEPTGKNILIGLDVSGSMSSPIAGTALTARTASAAIALIFARTEKNVETVAFSSGGWTPKTRAKTDLGRNQVVGYRSEIVIHPIYGAIPQMVPYYLPQPSMWGNWDRSNAGVQKFAIESGDTLRDVIKRTEGLPFGGTDCALPILYAHEQNIPVDTFITITDNETWAGDVHPSVALKEYRKRHVPTAQNIVIGMTATEFTINDPQDPNGLDVVGFDTAVPTVMADFMKGGDEPKWLL